MNNTTLSPVPTSCTERCGSSRDAPGWTRIPGRIIIKDCPGLAIGRISVALSWADLSFCPTFTTGGTRCFPYFPTKGLPKRCQPRRLSRFRTRTDFSNLPYFDGTQQSPVTIYDPLTTTCDANGNCTREAFPNNSENPAAGALVLFGIKLHGIACGILSA